MSKSGRSRPRRSRRGESHAAFLKNSTKYVPFETPPIVPVTVVVPPARSPSRASGAARSPFAPSKTEIPLPRLSWIEFATIRFPTRSDRDARVVCRSGRSCYLGRAGCRPTPPRRGSPSSRCRDPSPARPVGADEVAGDDRPARCRQSPSRVLSASHEDVAELIVDEASSLGRRRCRSRSPGPPVIRRSRSPPLCRVVVVEPDDVPRETLPAPVRSGRRRGEVQMRFPSPALELTADPVP